MKTPEFTKIPTVIFAHRLTVESHHAVLEYPGDALEISAVVEGYLDVETADGYRDRANVGDVIANFHRAPLKVDTDEHHVHLTAAYTFETSEPFSDLPLITRSIAGTAHIIKLLNDIVRIHTIYPEDKIRTSGLFLQLFGELCLCGDASDYCSPSDRLYVKRAKDYIYEHITEPIMQKNIATYLGISPEYLCTIFKKTDGRSVIRFINEIKLDNIRDLMESRGLTLCQASTQYGFSDPNYVSKLYKKYYNENITRHRNKSN